MEKGTVLFTGDGILPGLTEYRISKRKSIKIRTFPGVTIQDMKFFIVKKNPEKIDLCWRLKG